MQYLEEGYYWWRNETGVHGDVFYCTDRIGTPILKVTPIQEQEISDSKKQAEKSKAPVPASIPSTPYRVQALDEKGVQTGYALLSKIEGEPLSESAKLYDFLCRFESKEFIEIWHGAKDPAYKIMLPRYGLEWCGHKTKEGIEWI